MGKSFIRDLVFAFHQQERLGLCNLSYLNICKNILKALYYIISESRDNYLKYYHESFFKKKAIWYF